MEFASADEIKSIGRKLEANINRPYSQFQRIVGADEILVGLANQVYMLTPVVITNENEYTLLQQDYNNGLCLNVAFYAIKE